jgi:L-rhamnose mutarotase
MFSAKNVESGTPVLFYITRSRSDETPAGTIGEIMPMTFVNKALSLTTETKGVPSPSLQMQKWEQLTWKFQQALPQSKPGEKWLIG